MSHGIKNSELPHPSRISSKIASSMKPPTPTRTQRPALKQVPLGPWYPFHTHPAPGSLPTRVSQMEGEHPSQRGSELNAWVSSTFQSPGIHTAHDSQEPTSLQLQEGPWCPVQPAPSICDLGKQSIACVIKAGITVHLSGPMLSVLRFLILFYPHDDLMGSVQLPLLYRTGNRRQ